ncbi:hypothetical protein DFH07DRAFT_794690 [Mycena maculata]|uniref:Uncharacterized protein n=1 Tax=Mycena maculata TaxID=230809 RepID=A0AAD7NXP9_9AGAR|nr:hypothetical protein DFH07DRAFT_794690 [Mycena maculata]
MDRGRWLAPSIPSPPLATCLPCLFSHSWHIPDFFAAQLSWPHLNLSLPLDIITAFRLLTQCTNLLGGTFWGVRASEFEDTDPFAVPALAHLRHFMPRLAGDGDPQIHIVFDAFAFRHYTASRFASTSRRPQRFARAIGPSIRTVHVGRIAFHSNASTIAFRPPQAVVLAHGDWTEALANMIEVAMGSHGWTLNADRPLAESCSRSVDIESSALWLNSCSRQLPPPVFLIKHRLW